MQLKVQVGKTDIRIYLRLRLTYIANLQPLKAAKFGG